MKPVPISRDEASAICAKYDIDSLKVAFLGLAISSLPLSTDECIRAGRAYADGLELTQSRLDQIALPLAPSTGTVN